MRAAEWGDHVIVQTLVQAGADVNRNTQTGETAMMRSAAMGHKEVSQRFLCAGAEPSVSRPDGWHVAMFAEDWGQMEIADTRERRANLNTLGWVDETHNTLTLVA